MVEHQVDDRDFGIDFQDWEMHAVARVASYVYTLATQSDRFCAPKSWGSWSYNLYPADLLECLGENFANKGQGRECKMLE